MRNLVYDGIGWKREKVFLFFLIFCMKDAEREKRARVFID